MKLYGYGYVKSVDAKDKFTAIKMNCYDGKDKDGKARYYMLSVRVMHSKDGQRIAVQPGQMLYLDGAELSIYEYNGKWYTEARTWKESCWVKGEAKQEQAGGYDDNDSIPF